MSEKMPVGVFTSIGAGLGADVEGVLGLELRSVQVHVPPPEMRAPEKIEQTRKTFADAGIDISLLFCGFAGDSYASIQIVRETVGLCPPATRKERVEEMLGMADYAAALGVPAIGNHIGFVSEDHGSKAFADMVATAQTVCDHCADLGIRMHLETGQETADTLLAFIGAVDRPNLAVNFDPANMILYGSGEPIAALRKVGRHVKSVHCKDGKWSDQPGEVFGPETPLGEGDVGMENFVRTLTEIGYEGPLTIEREIGGEQQIRDIRQAVQLLESLKAKLLP